MRKIISALTGCIEEWGRDWGGRIALGLGVFALLTVGWLSFFSGTPELRKIVSDLAPIPLGLGAIILAARAAHVSGPDSGFRWGWSCLAATWILYLAGDVTWAYNELVLHVDGSSWVTDLLFMVVDLTALIGILAFPLAVKRRRRKVMFWCDVVIIFAATWMWVWYLVLEPRFVSLSSTSATAMGWIFVTFDMLLAFLLLIMVMRTWPSLAAKAVGVLMAGLVLILAGDLLYSFQSLDSVYQSGGLVDGLWMLGQYLMLLSGQFFFMYRDTFTEIREAGITQRTVHRVMPYMAMAASYTLLVVVGFQESSMVIKGLVTGAMLVSGVAMVRQILLLGQNDQLLTESQNLAAELQVSEARFRSMVQNASDVYMVVDPDGTIRYMSPAVHQVFGYTPDELVGNSVFDYVSGEYISLLRQALPRKPEETVKDRVIELRVRRRDGSLCWVEAVITNLLGDANVDGVLVNQRDISVRKAVQEQMREQAFHDGLTGLANRLLFEDRVRHALVHQQRSGKPFAVLFLDLDNFKAANDTLGHLGGDQLLVEVAERLQKCLRGGDTVARFGGDEFAVLLDGASRMEAALVAQRIVDALQPPAYIQGKDIPVGASVGIAVSSGLETAEELVRNADLAMYASKSKGKGRYQFFEPHMHRAAVKRLELESELWNAVQMGQLCVYYQPLVMLDTQKIVGIEAEVRWNHPRQGLLFPGDFMGLADQCGLTPQIGQFVLSESCRQMRQWQQAFPSIQPLFLGVNLWPEEIGHPELIPAMTQVLQSSGVSPNTVVLDVRERMLHEEHGRIEEGLWKLKRLGVRLTMDNFGLGYTSLDYLRQHLIDFVKVDKAFVDGVGVGLKESALMQGLMDLAGGLDIDIIATGIERPQQVKELVLLNCHLGQGPYFGPPMEPADLEVLLRNQMQATKDA